MWCNLLPKLAIKLSDINLRDNTGQALIHLVAISDHVNVCKLFLVLGLEVDGKNAIGQTPLHLAAYNNSIEVIPLLVEQGANLYVKDQDGGTPLDYALKSDSQEAVEMLEALLHPFKGLKL